MSLTAPSQHRGPAGKAGARKAENNRIYAHPLPLLLIQPDKSRHISPHRVLGLLGFGKVRVENPHCEGVLDPATRSVWITNHKDAMVLWQRGFFGKGDLSRSEPSWYIRQVNARMAAGKYLTSEEIREKRRQERRQFKLDRARALAEAAAEAERAFAEGRQAAPVAIPSGATWKPQQSSLTGDELPAASTESENNPEDELLEDIEHLQLTLQEAFFLLWNFDCLTVQDPATNQSLSLERIWTTFQQVYWPPNVPQSLTSIYENRFDNPFFVHYVAYHYYRALGWVVKGGIKFCVDYLLYKRGPVFSHAEFAIVVLPVYEDPEDQQTSPFSLNNAEPFSWTWLSTINRVNSQVQKTLILTYVTIPSRSRVNPQILDSPAALAHFTVREVVLRRFVPARMRD